MYYPFIRGKQFELLMLREMASKIADWGFVPVIEPVKESFPALNKALDSLVKNNCHFVLIGNPIVGELREKNSSLWKDIINEQLKNYENYSIGLTLTADDKLEVPEIFFEKCSKPTAIIHYGFSDGRGLSALIGKMKPNITEHIFIDNNILYRKHFQNNKRILVHDGFICRNNRDYPNAEPFSDLYLTYQDYGCDGFGDFLIVGDYFKEGGGPAYAIAIHLTFVDPVADNSIAVKHFVSDQVDTPKDPAGKFLEALKKLINDAKSNNSLLLSTTALDEYFQLYEEKHFPGLGYTKKLSMQHHLELMSTLVPRVK